MDSEAIVGTIGHHRLKAPFNDAFNLEIEDAQRAMHICPRYQQEVFALTQCLDCPEGTFSPAGSAKRDCVPCSVQIRSDGCCPYLEEMQQLDKGHNINIGFEMLPSQPWTVRMLLDTSANWTIGDSVRVLHTDTIPIADPQTHTLPTLNPLVLRFVGTHKSSPVSSAQWSPVNAQLIHTKYSLYQITVQDGPILIKLYERSEKSANSSQSVL